MRNDRYLQIDPFSIIHDVIRQWWVILLFGISMALLTSVAIKGVYNPVYRTSATFAVTNKGVSTMYATDIQNTTETAQRFRVILDSNILKNKVAQELGQERFTAKTNASLIEETNLIQLTVEDNTALKSYRTMKSIIDNYDSVSGYAFNNIVLVELQHPTVPVAPSNNLLASRYSKYALVLGVLAGIVYVAVFSVMKDTVKNESEAKSKVDAKLLGTIAHENSKNKKTKRIPMRINNPMLSMSYVESIRLLVNRVQSRMDKGGHKILMVTSVAENEGKSTIASNLAIGLGQNGKKVLLVDCDLRRPSLYKIFDIPEDKIQNLPKALHNERFKDLVIKRLDEGQLHAIFNKTADSEIDALFTPDKMPRLLKVLSQKYDYIILDTPPMGVVSDVEIIASAADSSLLVVRQDMVLTKDINDSIDVLNKTSATVIGFVLNDVRSILSNTAYGYGSGYGSNNYYRGGYYGK